MHCKKKKKKIHILLLVNPDSYFSFKKVTHVALDPLVSILKRRFKSKKVRFGSWQRVGSGDFYAQLSKKILQMDETANVQKSCHSAAGKQVLILKTRLYVGFFAVYTESHYYGFLIHYCLLSFDCSVVVRNEKMFFIIAIFTLLSVV